MTVTLCLVRLMLGSPPSGLPRTPRSGVAFPTTSGLSGSLPATALGPKLN